MSSGRFRRLELDPDATPRDPDSGTPQAVAAPPAVFHRALEVEGAIGLDESGVPRTHFCRGCAAENPEGARACFSCGGALGGPGQDAFDARMQQSRAARRSAPASEAPPPTVPAHPAEAPQAHSGARSLPPETDVLLQEILRESEQRHEPGFGSILVAGVLLAALFALVWIPVRTALSLGSGTPLQGRGLLELGFSAVGALWLRRRFRRELDGL